MSFCCNIGEHKMHRRPPPPLLWKERPCVECPITWEITSPWNHLSPAPSTLNLWHSFPTRIDTIPCPEWACLASPVTNSLTLLTDSSTVSGVLELFELPCFVKLNTDLDPLSWSSTYWQKDNWFSRAAILDLLCGQVAEFRCWSISSSLGRSPYCIMSAV